MSGYDHAASASAAVEVALFQRRFINYFTQSVLKGSNGGRVLMDVKDFSTKIPVWYQLVMMLRTDILTGKLERGGRIPSEVRLAAQYGVSVMPVRQALNSLEADGLIVRRPGRGTFVSDHNLDSFGSTSLEALYSKEFDTPAKVLERGIVAPPAPFQSQFKGVPKLSFFRRVAYRGGKPWSYGLLYFLPEFDVHITTSRLRRFPLYRIMELQCGVRLGRSKFEAQAKGATIEVARHLEIEPFSPVLSLTCISSDTDGRFVGAYRMSFIAEPYVFSFETTHGDFPAVTPRLGEKRSNAHKRS